MTGEPRVSLSVTEYTECAVPADQPSAGYFELKIRARQDDLWTVEQPPRWFAADGTMSYGAAGETQDTDEFHPCNPIRKDEEMSTAPDLEFEALKRTAFAAVDAARRDEQQAVADYVRDICRDSGAIGIMNCLVIWSDMLLRALIPTRRPGQQVIIGWVGDGKGDGTLDSTGLRPTVLWATRLVEARAADDEAAFRAICAEDTGGGTVELVLMVGITLNNRDHLASKTVKL